MTELPPPPPPLRSPEQPLLTPTEGANTFLKKWANKILASTYGLSTVVNGLFSLDNFARGDSTHGFIFLTLAVGSAIPAGINIAVDKIRKRKQ